LKSNHMDKMILVALMMMCVGCVSTGAPGGDPCKKRGFDDWVSFYDLRDKAESSWNEDYQNAYRWLEDVARACHPERFEEEEEDDDTKHEGIEESIEQENPSGQLREAEGRPAYEIPQDFFQVEASDVSAFEEEK